ncbi:MAG: PAS domain-containing protein, partial [Rhodospirillaceae bacterium]
MLVSKTDMMGRITFVNAAFIDVSGFSEEELIGSAHNLVRHPDMPQEAFKDLWETIKAGNPWQGLVKNRTKSGDHYWVRANVMPIAENGKISGYVSIRSKPSREEVKAAESIYARFRKGEARGITISAGRAAKPLPLWRRNWNSVRGRRVVMVAAMLICTAVLGGLGRWRARHNDA